MPKLDHLPIDDYKNLIIDTVNEAKVTLLVAQTGSGKTTRVPQFLATPEKHLLMTQPRRVATWTIARRICSEKSATLGKEVGYIMRQESKISPSSYITICTDGVMLNMLATDGDIPSYSYIIIDEFQERTSFTDISIALLKEALRKRDDLKLIITSATLNIDILTSYFSEFSPKLLDIPGRTYPIDINYLAAPTPNYLRTIKNLLKTIMTETNDGDVLVFLPTVYDINVLYKYYSSEATNPGFIPLRLHTKLKYQEQVLIFQTHDQRAVIFSTNVAEAAVTVPNISHVIDTGLAKTSSFDPDTRTTQLIITPISKAAAQQRAGRAGRVRHGTVYRLYTESSFNSLIDFLPPEIQRMPLHNPLCYIFSCGYNPISFDWITRPSEEAIMGATHYFYSLDLIDIDGKLTKIGAELAKIPLDIGYSVGIYRAGQYNCSSALLKIYSAITTGVSFTQDKKLYEIASQIAVPASDHLTLLNIFNGFLAAGNRQDFCKSLQISYDLLVSATIMYDNLYPSFQKIIPEQKGPYDPSDILKVLSETHIANKAKLVNGVYMTGTMQLSPAKTSVFNINSVMIGNAPKDIIYEDITFDKSYIIGVISKCI